MNKNKIAIVIAEEIRYTHCKSFLGLCAQNAKRGKYPGHTVMPKRGRPMKGKMK